MRTDASLLPLQSVHSTYRRVNGVRLHVVKTGPVDGPPVVLLHGFPDFWFGWREQLSHLADAGFRVLVPDQRGYNLSAKPHGVSAYRLSELVEDVAALIESETRGGPANVVGHDWGGGVAWELARRHPALVARLAVLNAPHPAAFARSWLTSPRQLARSWYVFFFQLPGLPERVLDRHDASRLERMLRANTPPGTFSPETLAAYREAWRHRGALTAMLNWYRAMPREGGLPSTDPVLAPTLLLWGDADPSLAPKLAEQSLAYCDDATLDHLPDVSHWPQVAVPERVNEALLDHFR
jgi:pimeloyl-ACP methyl ester carboxylesterase